ncbi:MAG: hypothetical protein ACI89W_000585 [Gammaproteobacteria bacterium]|jgi:hypothetical protein
MTIIFVRKIELQAGKDSQGLEMAKKLASHIKETQGLDVQLVRQLGGNPRMIAWTSRYDNLAAFETTMKKMQADDIFQAMSQEAAGIYKEGTVEDQLLKIIDQ